MKKPSLSARKVRPSIYAGDWFGCGRTITQTSWDGFPQAYREHYQNLDRKAARKPKTRPSLTDRKARLEPRWANSRDADHMGVIQVRTVLADLDREHTHAALDCVAQAWRDAVAKQGTKP